MLDSDGMSVMLGLLFFHRNLTTNKFECDCCLEWLFDCGLRDIVTLGTEQCSNLAELNNSISMLNMRDVCPNCGKIV